MLFGASPMKNGKFCWSHGMWNYLLIAAHSWTRLSSSQVFALSFYTLWQGTIIAARNSNMNYIYLGVYILLAFFAVSVKLWCIIISLLRCNPSFLLTPVEKKHSVTESVLCFRSGSPPCECRFGQKVLYILAKFLIYSVAFSVKKIDAVW